MPARGDQRWSTFLKNHATTILACDFFVTVTATFRLPCVFIVIEHGSCASSLSPIATPRPSSGPSTERRECQYGNRVAVSLV